MNTSNPLHAFAHRVWRVPLACAPLAATFFLAFHRSIAEACLAGSVLILFWLCPPGQLPSRWISISFLVLLVAPLFALLPVDWFGAPQWRAVLASEPAIELGPFVTPGWAQLLSSLPVYYAGLFFAWWCVSILMGYTEANWLAAGIVLLAAAAGLAVILWVEGPLTDPVVLDRYFVPFMSRNALADWLAVCGVVGIGLVHQAGIRGDWKLVLWLAGLAVIITALLDCGSRSGLVLLGLGAILFAVCRAYQVAQAKTLGIAVVAALAGVILIQYAPGESAERIRASLKNSQATEYYRLKVQRDALDGIGSAVLTGWGLGNLDEVLAFYRTRSAREYRPQHPDNDLLFFSLETGAVAGLAAMVAFLAVLVGMTRSLKDTGHPLRAAGVAAFLVPFVHSFWESPLHSPPVFFLAGLTVILARPSERKATYVSLATQTQSEAPEAAPNPVIALCNRVFPSIFLLAALIFLLLRTLDLPPGAGALLVRQSSVMSWDAWQTKGLELLDQGRNGEAVRAFAISRTLEPFAVAVPEREAMALLRSSAPQEAVPAAKAAVERSSGSLRWERLTGYLQTAPNQQVREAIYRSLQTKELPLMVVWLAFAPPDEARALYVAIQERLDAGESLDPRLQDRLAQWRAANGGGAAP